MKPFIKIIVLIILIEIPAEVLLKAQSKSEDLIFRAMKDELTRNMTQLKLETFKSPFFIAYQISDLKTLYIKATLGSIIQSQQNENRSN